MIHFLRTVVVASIGLLIAAEAASAHPHVWITMKSEVVYAPDGTVTGVRHAWTFDDMFTAFAIQGLEPAEPPKPAATAAKPERKGFFAWLGSTWNWLFGSKSETPQTASAPAAQTQPSQVQARLQAQADTQDNPPTVDPKLGLTRQQLQPLAEVNVSSLKEYDFFTYAKVNGRKVKFVEPTDYYLEYKDSVMTLHFMLPLAKPAQVKSFDFEVFDPTYFVDFALAEKDPASLSGAPENCALTVKGPQQPSQPNVQRLPDAQANQPETLNFGAQFSNKISVKCP